MSYTEMFHLKLLQAAFNKKHDDNPSYSIRAYANLLKINQSTLSSILAGKRHLPESYVEHICTALNLSESDKHRFIQSAKKRTLELKNIREVNEPAHVLTSEELALISTPEAYAVLSLLDLDIFVYDVNWMASYLNLQKSEVETIIANLIHLKLAEVSEGTLVATKRRVTTTDEIKSESIFNHHAKCLQQAMKIGESLSPEFRYFSTITLPTNLELLGEAKVIIREFEEKLEALLGESYQKKDIVRFSIQLYPLSEISQ